MAVRRESRSLRRSESPWASSPRSAVTWSSTLRTSPLRAQPAVSPRLSANDRDRRNRGPTLRLLEDVAAGEDLEFITTVLCPRALIVALRDGALFAVGDGLEAASVDAVLDEVLFRPGRAPVAQREVVLIRAALVAMAADADAQPRVRLQDRHLLIQGPGVVGLDVRFVEVEVDHRGEHVLHFRRRARRRRRRVRGALARDPLGFLRGADRVLPRLLPGERVLPGPLGRDRIGIWRRRRRRYRLGPAPRGDSRRGQCRHYEPRLAVHLGALSLGRGLVHR